MNIENKVLEFFNQKGGLPGSTPDEQLACPYLDAKVIDSMGIIDMVTHFEDTFQIRFSAEDLQSQEFQTVRGLVGLIEKLKASV